MYHLKVIVDEVKGFCDMPMKPGDYFEIKEGKIFIPDGKYMCMWALQSLMPLLPLKERNIVEDNDWVPYTNRICCPDPNGMVIYRIETVPVTNKHTSTTKDESFPKSRILVDSKKCTGCRACETICSFHMLGDFCSMNTRIRIEKDEETGLEAPFVCRQCGNAPCVNACPMGAISKDPTTKAILVDEAKCIACQKCSEACAFRSISFHTITQKALICDLCKGDPQCIKKCPSGAIVYGNAEHTIL